MKIKIQLFQWDTPTELLKQQKRIADFAKVFDIQLQKAEYDHYGNIFVVQLPEDDQHLCWLVNATASWVGIFGHEFEIVPDDYPSQKM